MEHALQSWTEITAATDPLFLEWLDLYETAFPPAERLLVSTLLKMLTEEAGAGEHRKHFVAMQSAAGGVVGMMLYSTDPEQRAAVLWYLAIKRSKRCQGLGTVAYGELLKRLDPASYDALLFEVEIPRRTNAEEARRRIEFYRRQGAFLLEGIRYLQFVGWHYPPTPMHIMVQPLHPLDWDQAFALAKKVFGDAIQRRSKPRSSSTAGALKRRADK
jgi:ribosomal protein S18 acetylase RimI-like enzyme